MIIYDADVEVNTFVTLSDVLEKISMENTALDFKWRFEAVECDHPKGWFVWVTFERPDTDSNDIGIGKGRKEFIFAGTSESGVVKTCWLLIELVIHHELMEAFRYKGKRIFNPHNSVNLLAAIQG